LGDSLLNDRTTVNADRNYSLSVNGHEFSDVPLHIGRCGGPLSVLVLLQFDGRHRTDRRRVTGLGCAAYFFADTCFHRCAPGFAWIIPLVAEFGLPLRFSVVMLFEIIVSIQSKPILPKWNRSIVSLLFDDNR
jgi:hypothetical protein